MHSSCRCASIGTSEVSTACQHSDTHSIDTCASTIYASATPPLISPQSGGLLLLLLWRFAHHTKLLDCWRILTCRTHHPRRLLFPFSRSLSHPTFAKRDHQTGSRCTVCYSSSCHASHRCQPRHHWRTGTTRHFFHPFKCFHYRNLFSPVPARC